MKLQNLTVIFAIIVIPITLILSAYIGKQIDTASLQQSYNTTLMDATHDAVVAFELNTEDNQYSTNADAIRRDILASINTFSTSLATGLGVSGANPEYIMPYIPAILITLYDGYYIYSPSEHSYEAKELNEQTGEFEQIRKTGYAHTLKPYIYYSAKYQSGDNYIIVNYTLDNYITLYGKIGNEAISKSGYLSTKDFRDSINQTGEYLKETIKYENGTNINTIENCPYIYQSGQKVYIINQKGYTLSGQQLKEFDITTNNIQDTSAIKYKQISEEFMNYISQNRSGTSIVDIVIPKNQINGKSKSNEKILLTDTEDLSSEFNQHKQEIIRQSIQDNLNNAMAIYNQNSASNNVNAYFSMPKMEEEDWSKIINNVNIVTFMQGLPTGTKIYNNYSIVTSTNNKQYIDPDTIYIVSKDKYHTLEHLINESKTNLEGAVAYKAIDFNKVKYNVTINEQTKTNYYYKRKEYACYDCIVSTNKMSSEQKTIKQILEENDTLKTIYNTALARERYNLDKVTKIFL